jgi:hypothetical protein
MSTRRRGAVALAVALIATLVAPVAAFAAPGSSTTGGSSPTSTTRPPTSTSKPTKSTTPGPSTTTTTIDPKSVPPPPAFTLPLDLGLKLLAQRAQATKDLLTFSASLPSDQVKARGAQQSWNAVERQLVRLEAKERETQHDLDVAHDDLQAAAVEAYMSAGSNRLEAAITAISSASSALDASRTMNLIGSYGDQQDQLVKEYVALQKELVVEHQQVVVRKHAADVMLASAQAKVSSDKVGIAHAHTSLVATVLGIFAFEKAATSASSPILGPSVLTAKQLADFVVASGHVPRITVPLLELAQDYITEGENAGVRGDVAFAQSLLETAWFTFPGGGQVAITDNNFAGIGACDSCAHGFSFPTADIGVRAQMQALRIYVDPTLTATTLKQPLVMPKMLNLGFRGKVQTWWDLWGTWATGAFYGQRVYDIYERMVAFARTDPAQTAAARTTPGPTAPAQTAPVS